MTSIKPLIILSENAAILTASLRSVEEKQQEQKRSEEIQSKNKKIADMITDQKKQLRENNNCVINLLDINKAINK